MANMHITYSFAEFLAIAEAFENARIPVLLRGSTGIGKSELIEQRGKLRNLPVISIYAAQIGEGDLTGLADPGGIMINGHKATHFNPAAEIVRACTEPCVLFFDELDRGVLEVRQGIFQIAATRQYKGWTLHPDTLVYAAINGGLHASVSQFQVGEMDPAELSRWSAFDVKPTIQDWLDYSKPLINDLIWDFIAKNHAHLEHNDRFEPHKKYPDRRGWHRLDRVLFQAGIYTSEDYKSVEVGQRIFMIANAIVGLEAATALRAYAAAYDNQLSAEDILVKGKIAETKKLTVAENNALIRRIIDSGCFERDLTDTEALNVVKYFMVLPSELAMHLYTNIQGHSKRIANIVQCQRVALANKLNMNMHLVSITRTNKEQKA